MSKNTCLHSRKFNFCFWFAFSAVILIILLIFKPDQSSNFWNKQNFHTLFLLPITALYQIIFLLATELFSTEIRGRAITMASVLARTTAIITPQVTIYCTSKNDFSFMYGLLLSLCCLQFVTVWFLPETKGEELQWEIGKWKKYFIAKIIAKFARILIRRKYENKIIYNRYFKKGKGG